MPEYAIFVFPTPWRWLSLAWFALTLALYGWYLWRQRQIKHRIAHIAEPLVDICRRHGFTAEAEQIQRDVDRLQRSLVPGGPWRTRREVVTTDGS